MFRLRFAILSILLICAVARAQTIFSDDFNDNDAGWEFEALTNNFGLGGGDVEFGFDYSMMGIPEAPNSVAGNDERLGVRLRVNNTGGSTDQGAISIESEGFAGQYTVQVDMWLNWAADPSLIGTTEHGGLYVGDAQPSFTVSDLQPIQRGAGAMFSTDGDCGNCDHILLKNLYELDTYSGQYSVRDFGFGNQPGYDDSDVNTDSSQGDLIDLPSLFPSFTIADANGGEIGTSQGVPGELEQRAGALGFQWVTVTAVVDAAAIGNGPNSDPGTATFSVENATTGESYTLGTVDNSQPDILDDNGDGLECDTDDICVNNDFPTEGDSPVDMEGRVSLFLIDFFSGGASDLSQGFALFDNLIVSQSSTSMGVNCDSDGDGDCQNDDIDAMYDAFGSAGQFDYDGSGVVDQSDLAGWLAEASTDSNAANTGETFVTGDANLDGRVDSTDLGLLLNNFGADAATPGDGAGWGGGDLNMDANVDSTDLGLLLNNFGATSAAVAVPEPQTFSLFALAMILLGVRARPRTHRQATSF